LLLQQQASKDMVHDRVLSSLKMEGTRLLFFLMIHRPYMFYVCIGVNIAFVMTTKSTL
jgi:hypothetical protein